MNAKRWHAALLSVCIVVITIVVASFTLGLTDAETNHVTSNDVITTHDLPRFVAIDVSFNPDNHAIGGWQLAVTLPEHIEIVGIENSQHPAFSKSPPTYDPAAIGNHRVILAQLAATEFDVESLPNQSTRMTTLHLMIEANSPAFDPQLDIVVDEVIGIDSRGERFEPAIEFEIVKTD